MSTQKLTAIIITFNEIDYITQCVNSILFADEIIAVDSFSTDGTWEFLNSHPKIKAIQHPFENFTTQKSYALQQASNDWVYFLDADERVTPSLQKEIIQTINSKDTASAYWNYRSFMFENKRLYFSGWQTDKIQRLFRKSRCEFVDDRLVHETLKVDGSQAKLKEKLIHYSYKNYEDYKGKMLKYGRLRALEEFNKGKKWTLLHQILRPCWKYFNHYIIRLGILDGKKGIIICYLNALGVHERYKELKRLRTNT
ncbi:glycosyltransferase family 2 protein [Abyssalbus ytuae]|uniref:Glycosyltransferase family 2 protein n=1 Tax=Abyssalbus ytuae TaxID=2926907 RepID=A0A9E6ZZZ2_9FLAO|nr:glycosyltransferase family 2 protein [Abyssalbus ytuae]UOB18262.1 glycosyltransferase family 2 protein [Abyssalbus ytuae]